MTLFTFETERWLPASRERVFAFFGNAENLQSITPAWLDFSIITPLPLLMRTGTEIDYRLRVRGVPLRWRTQITCWAPPYQFVDEQRRGPYRRWVHTHTFLESEGGTLCRDHVVYAVPGGRFVNRLFVRGEVEKIFAYRSEALGRLFSERVPAS